MRLHEYKESSVDVLELEGEIDMHFAPVLRQLLCGKRDARCPALLLDLTAVEFIDSTGLAVILAYVRDTTAYDGRFCIGGVSENLRSIFEIVRLDRAIPIFADVAAAKHALLSGRMPAVSEPLFASAA
ncbi:MAG TPA: STAS domain-containing protein [Chthoniobacterales bacterium]|nr:STAS domain-containing protein [Chthoniobacterales bacterium]